MGRLIDANKAQKDFIIATGKRSLIIDTAETVDAIPIDWLNQRIETLVEIDGLLANLWAALMMKMVEEWEKEQNGK